MNGSNNNNRAPTPKQMTAIAHFLSSGSVEEACRRARVGKSSFYKRLKDDQFKEQIRERREAITRQTLEILKAAISKATALKWGSVDLLSGKATFALSRNLGEENAPKTRANRRTVTLLPNVVDLLKTLLPLRVEPNSYVFTDGQSNP